MRTTIAVPAQAPACTGRRLTARRAAPQVSRRLVSARAVEAAGAEVPPLSDEVAAKLAELGIDFERSGLKYLPNEARVGADDARFGPPAGCLISPPARPGNRACLAALWVPALTRSACRTVGRLPSLSLGFLPLQMRALDRKSAKFEKTKNEKCGSHMWEDVTQLAQLIRCAPPPARHCFPPSPADTRLPRLLVESSSLPLCTFSVLSRKWPFPQGSPVHQPPRSPSPPSPPPTQRGQDQLARPGPGRRRRAPQVGGAVPPPQAHTGPFHDAPQGVKGGGGGVRCVSGGRVCVCVCVCVCFLLGVGTRKLVGKSACCE
jgi:hypothetical protein